MKTVTNRSLLAVLLSIPTLVVFNSCSVNEAELVQLDQLSEQKITSRTNLSSVADLVRIKVAEREQIPIEEILTCFFYGQTVDGFYEYRYTTKYSGPGIYLVIGIIGEELEGV